MLRDGSLEWEIIKDLWLRLINHLGRREQTAFVEEHKSRSSGRLHMGLLLKGLTLSALSFTTEVFQKLSPAGNLL